ncbi:MAG: hypothetical protein JNJ83_04425 [Verrucomicrobiaceae bacterium]|nr:hypothetical protein [Verrucomicrobiaceae bacterium]
MPQPLTWSNNLVWNAPGAVWNGFVAQPKHPMTNDNKISATLSAQDMTDILAAFATVKAKMPFLINLSLEEKRRMPTISTERGGMVDTFTMEMDAHPDLIPGFLDLPELVMDKALFLQLDELRAKAEELCEGIKDTQQAVGSDMYLAYLSFYNSVKQAVKRSVVGADAIFQNLRRFFQRGGGTPPTPPSP